MAAPGQPRSSDRHDARDRPRYEPQIQRDLVGRPRSQLGRMLKEKRPMPDALPRPPGRTADACDRGQSGRAARGASTLLPCLCARGSGQCPGARPDAGRHAPQGANWQGGRGRAGARAHHLQQEWRAVRSGQANHHFGHPLGTPAATTRGFGVAEFREVGARTAETLEGLAKAGDGGDVAVEAAVRTKVAALTGRYPLLYARMKARNLGF